MRKALLLAMASLSLVSVLHPSGAAQAPAGIEDQARRTVRETLSLFTGKPKEGAVKSGRPSQFTASGCARVAPGKWARLLLLNEPIYHEVRFSPTCDLQGKLRITQGSFPVDLALKNAGNLDRIRARVQAELRPRFREQDVDVTLTAKRGVLSKKSEEAFMGFGLEYGLKAGLDGKLKENRGGSVLVDSYRGKKVSVTERFRVD